MPVYNEILAWYLCVEQPWFLKKNETWGQRQNFVCIKNIDNNQRNEEYFQIIASKVYKTKYSPRVLQIKKTDQKMGSNNNCESIKLTRKRE